MFPQDIDVSRGEKLRHTLEISLGFNFKLQRYPGKGRRGERRVIALKISENFLATVKTSSNNPQCK